MSTVYITAKCSDRCYIEFEGIEHDGYVPAISGISSNEDYVELKIDNETGCILGWKPLTVESFEEVLEGR